MQTEEPKMTPELTTRAVVLGLVLSVVMGAANVYLGLKVGMTVSASIPAAVLAMLLLRVFLGNGTILEANQAQTAASAGESLAAGIIFTMPALMLVGVWQEFDMELTTLVAFTGGLLGVLLMIPMRRVFVTAENPELRFPEGVACAAVLRAGDEAQTGSEDALSVIRGAVFGLVFKFLVSFVGALRGTLEGAIVLGQSIFYFGGDTSVALLGVGLIVQLNIAALIFTGGALSWLIILPLLGVDPTQLGYPVERAYAIWSGEVRYVGVGAMVVGGIATIFQVRHGLLEAVRELFSNAGGSQVLPDTDSTDRSLPVGWIFFFAAFCILLIGGVYFLLIGRFGVTLAATVLMLVMAFFFTAVASYIVGLVGNSNSPVSGMTITAVLFTGAMLLIFGFTGTSGMLATLGVAAIVCCTACTAGDVCNDLKTGQLVGATPWKQQIMQIAGIAVAAFVMAPVLQLLHDNTPGGIGGKELAAPQAQLFASLVQGFFGDGRLPWDLVAIGAGLGIVIVIVDKVLQMRRVAFRAYAMPIAVGMYLPFGLSVPILIGGLMAHLAAKENRQPARAFTVHPGVLLASGAIAGESLTGIGIAVLATMGIPRLALSLPDFLVTTLTVVAVLIALIFFYRGSRPRGNCSSGS
jgi:putative OPT family oligopeptide transporter